MIFVTITQLSTCLQLSERTVKYKIAQLKKEKKFTKEYLGRNYTIDEAQHIVNLLNIKVQLSALIGNKAH